MRSRKLAVLSWVGPVGEPRSALVGIAVTATLEIVFDTVTSSRKYSDIRADPRVSFVVGWEGETTVQYEGFATEPEGDELKRAQQMYFAAWPEGVVHLAWSNIAYFLIRPKWIRYSDYDTRRFEEWTSKADL